MAITQPENTNTNRTDIRDQLMEDPRRKPHEKELALGLDGDGTHFEVTSFKKSVYKKLLENPHFQLKWFNVLDADGRETTAASYEEVAECAELRVIGVIGWIPVGAFSISSSPRNSNSHAEIVK